MAPAQPEPVVGATRGGAAIFVVPECETVELFREVQVAQHVLDFALVGHPVPW